MIERLVTYFQYPFVQYAMIVGILTSLTASILGVTLVLKRFSYIGDGLSHVAFGAMAVASVLKLADMTLFVLPATILSAVLLLKTGKRAKVKGDAMIAMISVAALAIGYLIMNIASTSSNVSGDVCTTLFGSTQLLTLDLRDVIMTALLCAVVIAIFVIAYNKIFAVTFDEDFAQASGTNTDMYNTLIAVVTAVVIVLSMNLVGTLLISALVIFPALSAMRLFSSFRSVTVASAVIAVFTAALGMVISIMAETPVGSTIVVVDLSVFMICYIIGRKA